MIKRYLSDYHRFKCIADQCPATCCSGWAIEIDDASLSHYETFCNPRSASQYSKEAKQDFSDRIDWQEEIFKQQDNGDCAFLRQDGLCHMQAVYGESFLCKTCDTYPRHIEEFPDTEEYSLSVSCPVAAKMLLEHQASLSYTEEVLSNAEADSFLTAAANGEGCPDDDYEDFQYDLYEILFSCREIALELMTDRTYTFAERSQIFLAFMKEVQNTLDQGEFVDVVTAFKHCKSSFESSCASASDSNDASLCTQVLFTDHVLPDVFDLLFELEPLRPDFRLFLEKLRKELPMERVSLQEMEAAFRSMHPDTEQYLENISVYFLYTYMCGAVYDDYVYAMSCMAVYNAYMILLLWMGKWNMDLGQERPLSLDALCEILYGYSRELEHSNENMILLEELLDSL